jgi:hypothetical protein
LKWLRVLSNGEFCESRIEPSICIATQVLNEEDDATFWDVTPPSFVDSYQLFGGMCCVHFQSSKHSLYQITWRHIPEGSNLQSPL